MLDFEDFLSEVLPEGWSTDGYGIDCLLICEHGHLLELDAVRCPDGCQNPLPGLGII